MTYKLFSTFCNFTLDKIDKCGIIVVWTTKFEECCFNQIYGLAALWQFIVYGSLCRDTGPQTRIVSQPNYRQPIKKQNKKFNCGVSYAS